MTSWASVPRTCAFPTDLPATPAAPLAVRSAALSVTGTLLAASAAAWTLPMLWPDAAQAQVRAQAQAPSQQVEQPSPVLPAPSTAASARTVAFDYTAEVAPNDVYDGARAEAPLPLFRSLGDRVDVSAVYSGPAAHVRLVARLSSTTGWTTTVPLASEVQIEGRGTVRASLALRQLEERAALVASQTEMPFEGMTVELVAAVRDDSGTWTPSVALQLSAQQLRLVGEPTTLVVQDASAAAPGGAPPAAPTPASRIDDLLGWRPGGMLTSLALTLGVAGGVVVLRRRRREDDVDQARRRLGRLLLEVRPADLSGVRVVEVASPDALARLAERYGLLVLHWTDDADAVFVVQDEATAYRWTVGTQTDRTPEVAEHPEPAEHTRTAGRVGSAEHSRPAEHSVPLLRSAPAVPAPRDVPADRPGYRDAPAPVLLAGAPRATEPDALTALALLLLAETRETAAATAVQTTAESIAETTAREQAAREQAEQQQADRAARLEAARQEVARLEAERQEADRREVARREAERLEAVRQDAARREAERRRHLELAERARAEADRAQQARVEAERLERRRRTEAAEALAALERAEQRAEREQRAVQEQRTVQDQRDAQEEQQHEQPRPGDVARAAVPAPRDGERPLPVRPVAAGWRFDEELADGPPRQADERPRPPSSFFEVG